MADITIGTTAVAAGAGAARGSGTAGATITQGQAIYYDSTTGTYKLADTETSATTANAKGISLNACSSGQPVDFVSFGAITLSAAGPLTVGEVYVLSTAGQVAPASDLASDDWVTVLGIATTANILKVSINASGVQVP